MILTQLYNSEVTIILDTLVPLRTVSCRRRPSDPWFDDECRVEKRCVQRLEREARTAASVGATDAPSVTRWTLQMTVCYKTTTAATIVVSLVLTRLDYGSVILAGLPHTQLYRLQSVLNAAARLVYSSRKYDHITPLLRELY